MRVISMNKYRIDHFDRREETLRGHRVAKNRERNRLGSAGLNVYLCLCQHAKLAKSKTAPVTGDRCTQCCGCKSRFTIRFSYGYEHTPDNEPNVDKQGQNRVRATWVWKHKEREFHDPEKHAKEAMSRQAKILSRVATLSYGVT